MALFPVFDDMKNRNNKVQSSDSREALRDWLAEYFATNGAKYEFKVTSFYPFPSCPNLTCKPDPTWHLA